MIVHLRCTLKACVHCPIYTYHCHQTPLVQTEVAHPHADSQLDFCSNPWWPSVWRMLTILQGIYQTPPHQRALWSLARSETEKICVCEWEHHCNSAMGVINKLARQNKETTKSWINFMPYQARCIQKSWKEIQDSRGSSRVLNHLLPVLKCCLHFIFDEGRITWVPHHWHGFLAFITGQLLLNWTHAAWSLGALLETGLGFLDVLSRVALNSFQPPR